MFQYILRTLVCGLQWLISHQRLAMQVHLSYHVVPGLLHYPLFQIVVDFLLQLPWAFTSPCHLRRCSPRQVETLSVRRVSPYQISMSNNHNIQLKPCSCRGVAQCGDPPVQCLSELGAIPLRPSAKTDSKKHQVSDHGPIVQMFRSQISTVLTSTNLSHLDVAIDHETLQPQRWCCDMSNTSGTSSHCSGSACRCIQLDFVAKTVDSTKPFRFHFNSLLLQHHSKFSHH